MSPSDRSLARSISSLPLAAGIRQLIAEHGYTAVVAEIHKYRRIASVRSQFLYTEDFAARDIQRAEENLRRRLLVTSEGCWLWQGPAHKKTGYGVFRTHVSGHLSHEILAHVAAYRIFIGPLSPRATVHQSCGNPLCCQPDHLVLGTPYTRRRSERHHVGTTLQNAETGECTVVFPSVAQTARRLDVSESSLYRVLCGQTRCHKGWMLAALRASA